jgi:hypothetical protein
VKSLRKILFWAGTAILAVVLLLVVALNMYLQSPALLGQVERELGKALGLPIQATSLSITPWGGMTLAGITVPDGPNTFLEASKFRAGVCFAALVRNELRLTGLRAEGVRVHFYAGPDGSWRVPSIQEPQVPKERKDSHDGDRDRERESKGHSSGKKEADRTERIRVVVSDFTARNGFVEFLASDGSQVAAFHNTDLELSDVSKGTGRGRLTAQTICYGECEGGEALRVNFSLRPKQWVIDDATVRVGPGGLQVQGTIDTGGKGTAFRGTLKAARMCLRETLKRFGGINGEASAGEISGLASGECQFSGNTTSMKDLVASGKVQVEKGNFKRLDVLMSVAEEFRSMFGVRSRALSSLADLDTREAHATFRIEKERIHLEPLVIGNEAIRFEATGPVRFDTKLDLRVAASMDESLIAERLRPALARVGDSKQRGVEFHLTGKLTKPKTNLKDALAGKKGADWKDVIVAGLRNIAAEELEEDRASESSDAPKPEATEKQRLK